jgi:2'-5' RNA ligase
MSRIFAALEIPNDSLNKIIEIRDQIYPDDGVVRWEKRSKLHITLKFYGEVDTAMITDIIAILKKSISEYSAFNLVFNKFGVFKHKGDPKIIYAGIKENKHLADLADKINDASAIIGFTTDKRKFKPHLTLLRVRGKEDKNKLKNFFHYEINEIDFIANKITLYESTLLKSGSLYNEIESFELK